MRHHLTILAFAMILVVAACGQADEPSESLGIVVTTTILGDVVANIVGDDATIEVLMPLGADPHDFQASAAQVARINAADLVIANGLGLEEGVLGVLATAASDGVRVFELAPLLDPLPSGGLGHTAHDDHHDDDHHDDDHHDDDDHADDHHDEDEQHDDKDGHHDDDPHVWMDPVRMADAARLIAAELTAVAPGIDWAARADAYAAELRSAHVEIESLLAAVPASERKMVTNHEVFGYFADRYGWEVVGTVIPGGSTLGAPSAADLADLIETIRHEGVRVIFAETSAPDVLAQVVADEVGEQITVVALHTESLGEPGSDSGTLIGMLLDNARRIVGAMAGNG